MRETLHNAARFPVARLLSLRRIFRPRLRRRPLPSLTVYSPPHFRETRPEVLLDVIQDLGAITLVTTGPEGMRATFVPVLIAGSAEEPVLVGHVSAANPQGRENPGPTALAIATGPHSYVSPTWYPSKATDGRVVPTWNYVHVQAHGTLEWINEHDEKLAIVSMLTDHHEASNDQPWAVSDAPDDFVAAKVAGVVGFRIRVTRLEGSFKLSQNQAAANRDGVVEGLRRTQSGRATAVADEMQR